MKNILDLILLVVIVVGFCVLGTGCQAMSDTAQKVSDDLGNKAINGYAFIDIWKITPSDPVANGAPSGKKVTIIGNFSSVPVVQGKGEIVLDFIEYENTETPAWYNKDNVTKVERLRWTSKNSSELQKAFLGKFKLDKEQSSTDSSEDSGN